MRVANQNMALSFDLFFTMSGIQKKKGAGRREMGEDIESGRSFHLLQSMLVWLVVSTHLKNIRQNGNLPQVGVKIKNI